MKRGTSKKEKVTAVIPAYNESSTIQRVVSDLLKEVHEVIVVDDGSRDDTARRANQAGAVVVKQARNQGYDAALNKGFSKAVERGATILFTFDADGQHSATDVKKITAPILAGRADVVVGFRPSKQRIMEHLLALYFRFKIGIRDPLCGLKAYRAEAYRSAGCFDDIGSTGTQLMFKAHQGGYRLAECLILSRKRKDATRFGKTLEGNYKLFKSFLKILFCSPSPSPSLRLKAEEGKGEGRE